MLTKSINHLFCVYLNSEACTLRGSSVSMESLSKLKKSLCRRASEKHMMNLWNWWVISRKYKPKKLNNILYLLMNFRWKSTEIKLNCYFDFMKKMKKKNSTYKIPSQNHSLLISVGRSDAKVHRSGWIDRCRKSNEKNYVSKTVHNCFLSKLIEFITKSIEMWINYFY